MPWQTKQYISLATRKRDGTRVKTPVWFAFENNTFYLFSEASAWKIKRIRNFSDVQIAPCTVTGKITGAGIEANATILETPADIAIAYQALLRKYGWKLRLLNVGSRLAGKINQRAFVKCTITS